MTEHDDAIALVGLAGRFPGAPDVAALWRNLLDGVDSVHDHTDDELRALGAGEAAIADPALVRGHGRLEGVSLSQAGFDAEFFGVPDTELAAMDPQQRLFVEQCWVALADAAVDPAGFDGAVGVFAGASVNRSYLYRLTAAEPGADPERFLAPGWSADYLPAQAAYRLGLTGPAVAVQTACSSSLVAVCLAAQGLLDFRCDVALAGGVSVTEPRFRRSELISPDGRCRAFDASAAGSGYGSGVAVVVLKRLPDALADGDQVYAVLRGWAVNNDGAARAGFAAPGLDGQAAVVAEALAGAELSASDVGLVEAHGSGTLVGDAIEVAALRQALAQFGGSDGTDGSNGSNDTDGSNDTVLGAVKTNLGNLDAAAGVTALVKAALAVRHGTIPANLHFERPNPELDLTGLQVPVKPVEFGPGVRRAGVSSFGLGGTNAHVIVEEPPDRPARPEPSGVHRLVLSARSTGALLEMAAGLRRHLSISGARLDDVAFTLAGRPAFGVRAVVEAQTIDEAIAALEALEPGAVEFERVPPAAGAGERVWLPPYPFQRRDHPIGAPA